MSVLPNSVELDDVLGVDAGVAWGVVEHVQGMAASADVLAQFPSPIASDQSRPRSRHWKHGASAQISDVVRRGRLAVGHDVVNDLVLLGHGFNQGELIFSPVEADTFVALPAFEVVAMDINFMD